MVHGSDTPRDAESRYIVSNSKILDVAITLEYIQDEKDTHLVESDNQQHIFIWVINNFNLPSGQGQRYTEWELCQACERIILEKSSYSEILRKFGVPNSTLAYSLNAIFLSLKFSSLKHLWYIIGVGEITKRIVREVMDKYLLRKRWKQKSPSQGQRSIYCGNILNIWYTWTPKRYTDLH